MPNTPMVVMWSNPDGTLILSQRMSGDYNMPTVDPNPPRIATISNLSSVWFYYSKGLPHLRLITDSRCVASLTTERER